MEELEKGLKELRGLQPYRGSNSVNRVTPHPPGASGDWTTYQRTHMERTMALATYVAKDGFVGHQWEEWLLGCKTRKKRGCPSTPCLRR